MERENERMEMLYQAAVHGNTSSLLRLLHEDVLILNRYISSCFQENPLHIASMLGHEEFVIEIISRKPELAKELDFKRRSPLHLATANGHHEIVKALLSVNREVCLARDGDGRNPLHIAVIKGQVEILKELIPAKPEAVLVRAEHGETILHLCAKHYQLEALKYLMHQPVVVHEFTNSKDDDGFTVLHLAVAEKQIETINFVLAETTIDIDAVNADGFTALDIALAQSRRDVKAIDIQDSLRRAGARREKDISSGIHKELEPITTKGLSGVENDHKTTLHPSPERKVKNGDRQTWIEQKRAALMVITSLIAAMAFQNVINPPRRYWPEEFWHGPQFLESLLSSPLDTAEAPAPAPEDPVFTVNSANQTMDYLRSIFLISNTIGFETSLAVTLLIISGLFFRSRFFLWLLMPMMWIAIAAMIVSYNIVLSSLLPKELATTRILWNWQSIAITSAVGVWLFSFLLLLLGHPIRLLARLAIFIGRLMKRGCSSSSVTMNQRKSRVRRKCESHELAC